MTIRAAGCLILNEFGQALFLKRGPGGDSPGLWAFPGGRLEPGEAAIAAAVRETLEESGAKLDPAKLKLWSRAVSPRETTGAPPTPPPGGPAEPPAIVGADPAGAEMLAGEEVDFTTFITKAESFTPELGPAGAPEHVAYAWAPPDAPPEPLHPGCRVALAMFDLDELGIARAMAAGQLASPQHYKNVALFDIRITGTGVAYRNAKTVDGKIVRPAEWVYRKPENYLTDEFVQRCNGLPVIMRHPEKALLNSAEFGMRIVGTIMLPFLKGDEVWGIAKIYDADAVEMLETEQMSTSPGVLLSGHDDQKITMEDGSPLLIEGKPALLDHIAICERGVWDKGGDPDGVNSIAVGDSAMAEDAKMDEKIDKLLTHLGKLDARLDAFEEEKRKEDKTRKDAAEAAEKEKADKARKDSEEKAEKEKADARAKADAEAKKCFDRKDGEEEGAMKARHDAEEKRLSDAFEKEGEAKEVAADRAKKARRDAEEEIMAEDKRKKDAEEKEKMDAAANLSGATAEAVAAMQAKLAELQAMVPRAVSDADYGALLDAQARADSVYAQHGLQAPRALNGETVVAYRKRLARGLQAHSPRWKDIDLLKFDDAAFGIAEEQVYADSAAAAANPADLPEGQLRAITRTQGGHTITEYRGSTSAWMAKFAGPVRHSVKRFNVPGGA
jgi:8-oxo-dGTP pyrophosphatase MutT (NUDIX family)